MLPSCYICLHSLHCAYILLNSIKPFYTGSPLRPLCTAAAAYFMATGGKGAPLTGRPGHPANKFKPVDATRQTYNIKIGVGARGEKSPSAGSFCSHRLGSNRVPMVVVGESSTAGKTGVAHSTLFPPPGLLLASWLVPPSRDDAPGLRPPLGERWAGRAPGAVV